MKKEEGRKQKAENRPTICHPPCHAIPLFFLLFCIVCPSSLLADGGTLRLSQLDGNLQCSVFTSPASPRVGMVDISVLVQDAATGKVRDDVPVTIHLQPIDEPAMVLQQSATSANATNKLFRAAQFDIPQSGMWRASVELNANPAGTKPVDHSKPPLTFEFAVAPPLPAWLEIAPWIGWPFAVLSLFLVHQIFRLRSVRTSVATPR